MKVEEIREMNDQEISESIDKLEKELHCQFRLLEKVRKYTPPPAPLAPPKGNNRGKWSTVHESR